MSDKLTDQYPTSETDDDLIQDLIGASQALHIIKIEQRTGELGSSIGYYAHENVINIYNMLVGELKRRGYTIKVVNCNMSIRKSRKRFVIFDEEKERADGLAVRLES
jgi:hypothetical protein